MGSIQTPHGKHSYSLITELQLPIRSERLPQRVPSPPWLRPVTENSLFSFRTENNARTWPHRMQLVLETSKHSKSTVRKHLLPLADRIISKYDIKVIKKQSNATSHISLMRKQLNPFYKVTNATFSQRLLTGSDKDSKASSTPTAGLAVSDRCTGKARWKRAWTRGVWSTQVTSGEASGWNQSSVRWLNMCLSFITQLPDESGLQHNLWYNPLTDHQMCAGERRGAYSSFPAWRWNNL